MKKISYSREATKTLIKIPANTAKLIRSKIEQYAAEPSSLANNVKVLKGGEGVYRLRVVTGGYFSPTRAKLSRL
ncbi:hypothetical protein [Ochrobactrum sp. AN78]|uniref:type II toxin-antitoxin system RelE family toxin n=1 Tax=Ochrobactrum sp. AN78 TaxID=3039853 RepID=UPI002989A05F|nr:hypothetical protein [Ochrobactrum sp. AN78]MDH7793900.1 mRNA-degrading endonuclease RelE of RelBE toxin-antitoxin system [Ochrobactrum sp. AN78]